MVIFNEGHKHAPDRLPEGPIGDGEDRYGYDDNYEYKLMGQFSGNTIYDPRGDLFLPEFVLRDYELINRTTGPRVRQSR